jgi:hypothetical protein
MIFAPLRRASSAFADSGPQIMCFGTMRFVAMKKSTRTTATPKGVTKS